MHELLCPSCNAPSQYDLQDYLLMCHFCSTTFSFDKTSGKKTVYTDHYLIPNGSDATQIKGLVREWLKRLHHQPGRVDKEYFVTEVQGVSLPCWIISLEAHTKWQGLVKRHSSRPFETGTGSEYLHESGVFRRTYRWGIHARSNLFEIWGVASLHEPKESVRVDWDGFPFDSTFSRGQTNPNLGAKVQKEGQVEALSAYDAREFFDFKFSNGLPILGVQIEEEEALRRCKTHVMRYHHELAKLHVDLLLDIRTELEIAGVQLLHLPFWHAKYVYRPMSMLKHFSSPREKQVVIEGYTGGILKGELPIVKNEKMWINTWVTAAFALVFFIVGASVHPSLLLLGGFFLVVSGISGYLATMRANQETRDKLKLMDAAV
jgi:hypothetical protein